MKCIKYIPGSPPALKGILKPKVKEFLFLFNRASEDKSPPALHKS